MGRACWFVYMLECKGNCLYTGVAVDVAARFEKHRAGKGAAYTRSHPPRRILAIKRCASRSQALKTEYRIKQLEKPEKLAWAARWRVKRAASKRSRRG